MRIVLADLRSRDGFVSKDTVAGGYGSRFRGFSRVTRVVCAIKQRINAMPSIQMAYIAAILADAGHDVIWSDGEYEDGDVAIVLTSLVDYRREAAWAQAQRDRGLRTGFVGLTASKMPELFEAHGDFVIMGEPEAAIRRLAAGEVLSGRIDSEPIDDLDNLPLPRWDLVARPAKRAWYAPFAGRPFGGSFPVLASRGCPEFCTYCPHRILAPPRARSVKSIVDEIEQITKVRRRPYIVFRDPLFTEDRARALELCDAITSRHLDIRFECETRLDRLDDELIEILHHAGLAAMSFGVETLSVETLKRAGRRPIPEAHQRNVLEQCRRRGIVTAGYFVFGFLQDTWTSIAATIDYATDLGPTVAQFKLLTPYPGTPMWKQLAPRVYETDWQKFDGYTPTFTHPNLTAEELRFLLGAAYTRFYMRPSYLTDYLRLGDRVRHVVAGLDRRVSARHGREEAEVMRTVEC